LASAQKLALLDVIEEGQPDMAWLYQTSESQPNSAGRLRWPKQ
jgi:hypothetical protein